MLDNLKNITEEILGEERLVELLNSNIQPVHYIGFEISGKPHIGSGIVTMMVIKELLKLNVKCKIFLADWHSWINNKLGGDIDFIREVGIPYFKENMLAAAKCVGVDPSNIEFVNGSDLAKDMQYWATVVDVGRNTSLSRIQRSITIMGRKEGDSVDFAKLMYPTMQAADIFYMGVHIAHAGMDQRKAHVIAIDDANHMDINPIIVNDKKFKPVAVHQHLLMGLTPPSKEILERIEKGEISPKDVLGELKMSKSKPDSAIFMNDSEEEVIRKINKAYCPEGITVLNPVLDWVENLCFKFPNPEINIKRDEKWGGNITYKTYEELKNDFEQKKLHPSDLKKAVALFINDLLSPAREHLSKPEVVEMAKKIEEKVTR